MSAREKQRAAEVAHQIEFLRSLMTDWHVGLEHAITIRDLAKVMGMSKRAMEKFIEEHIGLFQFPMVVDTRWGAFIPTKAAHINDYLESLDNRQRRVHARKVHVVHRCLAAGWQRVGKRFVDRDQAQPEIPLTIKP